MISDDERREVARRLREIEQGVTGAFIPTRELAESILRAIDYGRSGAMTPYGCLADLIEPSCDRDALLALADEFESGARVARARKWNEPANAAMAIALADGYEANARRIREALGVES